jgi:glycosyltransferase involved in cell wall biosynthesis
MRLAVFTSQFPGYVNTFFARDLRGLIDAGIDVEVFATHPCEERYWQYVPDELSEQVLPRDRVHHLSFLLGATRATTSGRAWPWAPHMASIVGSALGHGIQEAVKTSYVLPKAAAWAAAFGGRFDHVLAYWGNYAGTCAYMFHRIAVRQVPFSIFLHAGTDLYRSRVFLEQKLTYADNIFVVCDFNRRFLQDTYPETFDALAPKIHVHHLGLDLSAYAYRAPDRVPNRIVAVGGLHPSKGFKDLIHAAGILAAHQQQVTVRFVGDGPERSALEALAAEMGIRPRVDFLGWRSPVEVADEIARASILVHPSAGLGDAVPTVIKEAMALGTPVVASDVAGIPELLDNGRCGVLTPPGQPAALAEAVAALLTDPQRRVALSLAARQHAERLFDQTRNGASLADRLRRTPDRVVSVQGDHMLAKSVRS